MKFRSERLSPWSLVLAGGALSIALGVVACNGSGGNTPGSVIPGGGSGDLTASGAPNFDGVWEGEGTADISRFWDLPYAGYNYQKGTVVPCRVRLSVTQNDKDFELHEYELSLPKNSELSWYRPRIVTGKRYTIADSKTVSGQLDFFQVYSDGQVDEIPDSASRISKSDRTLDLEEGIPVVGLLSPDQTAPYNTVDEYLKMKRQGDTLSGDIRIETYGASATVTSAYCDGVTMKRISAGPALTPIVKPSPSPVVKPSPSPSPSPSPVTASPKEILASVAGLARFSKLQSTTANPTAATSLSTIRSIGCASDKRVMYFDLSFSDVENGRFRAITSGYQALGSGAPAPMEGLYRGLFGELKKGEINTISLRTRPSFEKGWDPVIFRGEVFVFPDMQAAMQVQVTDSRRGMKNQTENFTCELFDKPYFEAKKSQNVFYDCDGSGGIWLEFNRSFDMPPLVGYERESELTEIFTHDALFPGKVFPRDRDSRGQGLSNLEWATVGGVLEYTDWVVMVSPSEVNSDDPFHYARIFQSPDLNSLTSATPPDQFNLTVIENYSYYPDKWGSAINPPPTEHVCRRIVPGGVVFQKDPPPMPTPSPSPTKKKKGK